MLFVGDLFEIPYCSKMSILTEGMLQTRIKDVSLGVYSFLKISVLLLRYGHYFFGKSRIFVNYKSFGHSLIDTDAFLRYSEKSLCISIGRPQARNKFIGELLGERQYILILLPKSISPNAQVRMGKITYLILRLILVVPRKSVAKVVLIDDSFSATEATALELLKSCNLFTDSQIKTHFSNFRELIHTQSQFKRVAGTTLFAMLANSRGIPEQFFKNYAHELSLFLSVLTHSNIETQNNSSNAKKGFVTLIIRSGSKVHHGEGFAVYRDLLPYFAHSKDLNVLILGDFSAFLDIREELPVFTRERVFCPKDFAIHGNLVDIFGMHFSKYIFGDSSGLWGLFPLVSKSRGFRVNCMPILESIRNTTSLPKEWRDRNNEKLSPLELKRLAFYVPQDSKVRADKLNLNPRKRQEVTKLIIQDFEGGDSLYNSKLDIILSAESITYHLYKKKFFFFSSMD